MAKRWMCLTAGGAFSLFHLACFGFHKVNGVERKKEDSRGPADLDNAITHNGGDQWERV